MSEDKKIIIDEDWKAQVEAEKEAAKQASADPSAAPAEPPASAGGAAPDSTPPADASGSGSSAGGADSEDPPMPPASIGMLMSSLATEALLSMGQFPHPATGKVEQRLNQAKYLIDTLALLKEKTTGNLTSEEAIALDDVLHQLRMAFVSVQQGAGTEN